MKLWIAKNSEISVHDQIVEQVLLGIASNDLKPGERLPSTRAVARRFGVHQNTVSAAYRELAARDLVSFRHGSGVFVGRDNVDHSGQSLQQLFTQFLERASSYGFSRTEIDTFIQRSLTNEKARKYIVVESDQGLRDIVAAEIALETGIDTIGISPEEVSNFTLASGARFVAMSDEQARLENEFPDLDFLFLNANSVSGAMAGQARPNPNELIAIVSGWEKFIAVAKLYLLAAQIDPETIIACSTEDLNWKRAAGQASLIICDSLVSNQFEVSPRVRVFPLIARTSLEQLRG